MKVIQNNYDKPKQEKKQKHKVEQVKVKCKNCGSVLEVERQDVHTGWLGFKYVTCPCCKYEMEVEEFDDEAETIYASNLKYPTHFTLSDKNFGAIEIDNEKINEWIQRGIRFLRENKEEYYYFTGSGNTFVHIYRFDEDEEYYIVVSKDYESGEVGFEAEDYE